MDNIININDVNVNDDEPKQGHLPNIEPIMIPIRTDEIGDVGKIIQDLINQQIGDQIKKEPEPVLLTDAVKVFHEMTCKYANVIHDSISYNKSVLRKVEELIKTLGLDITKAVMDESCYFHFLSMWALTTLKFTMNASDSEMLPAIHYTIEDDEKIVDIYGIGTMEFSPKRELTADTSFAIFERRKGTRISYYVYRGLTPKKVTAADHKKFLSFWDSLI